MKKPKSKVSKNESVKMFRDVFQVSASEVKSVFRKNRFLGKWLLRGEAAAVAYALADMKLSGTPEEYLCAMWKSKDADSFEELYGSGSGATVEESPQTHKSASAETGTSSTATPVAAPVATPVAIPVSVPVSVPVPTVPVNIPAPTLVPASAPVVVPTPSGTTTVTGSTTPPSEPAPATPAAPTAISHTCGTPINVPAETASVQTAVHSACSGDTVYLAAGTYRENINLTKNGITLKGAAGTTQENVILDGGGGGNVITMNTNGVYKFTLEGVTIQNSSSSGNMPGSAGLFISPGLNFTADILIKNIVVKNNYTGIVIWNMASGRIDVQGSLIADNLSHGIESNNFGTSYAYFTNNTIVRNTKDGIHDWAGGGQRVYRNNILVNNGMYGISTHKSSGRTILYNNVWGNTAGSYVEGFFRAFENAFEPSPGTGEVSRDPLFEGGNNRYRLQSTSPMIDQGDPDAAYYDPDNSRNDIGAYPYGS